MKNFAMGYWGMALSYGPNINDIGYSASPEALMFCKRLKHFQAICTNVEKAWLTPCKHATVQIPYISKRIWIINMRPVNEESVWKFSKQRRCCCIVCWRINGFASMDLYDENYKPKSWTAIVNHWRTLEKNFQSSRACHYYIHAVEGPGASRKRIEVANRLAKRMSGAASVHMPSHIYIRSGYYKQQGISNEDAS